MTNTAVAHRYRTTIQTVGKWRKRFVEERFDGLYDEPRVGAPRTIGDDAVEAVLVKTLEEKPKGKTHWSTRSMAAHVGMSHATIGRMWRTFGLKPHITRSFKISEDPQFIAKVRDVVGLYMNPPDHAVVFSFDEKSQIQALERAQPILPMDLGQPERRTHNYVRHGTLDLFAALNVATGEIIAACKKQHRAKDFVGFLAAIDQSVEPSLAVRGARQPIGAQGAGRALVAAAPSALRSSFHADVLVVAQPRGTFLRPPHAAGAAARIAYLPAAAPAGNHRVRRSAQRDRQALQVVQDCRRDPRQGAALRPANAAGASSMRRVFLGIKDPGD